MVWFTDNFNRANESLDADADWVERGGDFDIVSNQIEFITGSAFAACGIIDSSYISSADYYVQSIINHAGTGGATFLGSVGRRADYSTSDSDGYFVLGRASTNLLYLYKRVSGSWTLLDSGSITINTATDYLVKLVMDGTTLSGELDSTEYVTATDSAISAQGEAGVSAATGASIGVTWDNIEVGGLGVVATTLHQTTNYQGMNRMNGAMR